MPGKLETGFWTQMQTLQAAQVQFIVLSAMVTLTGQRQAKVKTTLSVQIHKQIQGEGLNTKSKQATYRNKKETQSTGGTLQNTRTKMIWMM